MKGKGRLTDIQKESIADLLVNHQQILLRDYPTGMVRAMAPVKGNTKLIWRVWDLPPDRPAIERNLSITETEDDETES